VEMCKELLGYLYDKHNLRRTTGLIPSFNRGARKLAVLLGYKFEGEFREAFLYKGEYHGIQIYGLLRTEFDKRWA
jgi:RimJ/RimL family protein N-acetyltransferase